MKKEYEKFTVVLSRSPQNLEFGHFTLLFYRGRQKNVPKFKTHVQSDCFSLLNILFCGIAFERTLRKRDSRINVEIQFVVT